MSDWVSFEGTILEGIPCPPRDETSAGFWVVLHDDDAQDAYIRLRMLRGITCRKSSIIDGEVFMVEVHRVLALYEWDSKELEVNVGELKGFRG